MQRIGVVGFGLMGCGIAEVSARAGLDVVVAESNPGAVTAGTARLEKSLARAEAKGLIGSAADVIARVQIQADLDALADRELIIEAIVEDAAAKTSVFQALDRLTAPEAILASNTSSIPISKLGAATNRAGNVLGVHFFNPVPVLSLVELVPSLLTTEETTARARAFAEEQLGKKAIICQDRAGFVVNLLLVPFILSAIRMLEGGFASAEDIDEGLVRGCAHPQGPLALADLIGLDTIKAIADSLYDEHKEPTYAAPPLLARMVDAGLYGRKSGRGFYDYS